MFLLQVFLILLVMRYDLQIGGSFRLLRGDLNLPVNGLIIFSPLVGSDSILGSEALFFCILVNLVGSLSIFDSVDAISVNRKSILLPSLINFSCVNNSSSFGLEK